MDWLLVTTFLFEIGKIGLGLYFSKADPWYRIWCCRFDHFNFTLVSYSSMLVFYGAEFTHAYSIRNSGKVIPTEIAKQKLSRKPIS